ncbi:LptF/LptG family permease [Desulfonatronum sp. SC1]|uniref:LptF/LptG family permease n=1 Tax=Desulfonatronum sp. SC1 TaxID=2109626 RepID=UPI000D3186E5|nr:LptF/LptG family permease [Desulfonatronum sp. SC1]PTN31896.1 LPS export ABC transporter permease LptF [Desulfonatronum sp. SC1]
MNLSAYLPRRWTLLQKRVFQEICFLFFLTWSGLISLLLVGRLLQLRELFLHQQVSTLDIVRLFVFLSPFFLFMLIPVACLLSIFLVFLRMSNDRELIALKSGGVSLYQILPAPIIFSLSASVLALLISLGGISWGFDNFRRTALELAHSKTQMVLQPGIFHKDFPGLTIYAKNVDADQRLRQVFVEDQTRSEITAVIVAPVGYVVTEPREGRILFALEHGRIYRMQRNAITELRFDSYLVRLDLDQLLMGISQRDPRPKEMSWRELRSWSTMPDLVEVRGEEFANRVAVEIQKRWVVPAACLILGLLAIPLALAFEGLKRQYALILIMGVFFVFYGMFSTGIVIAELGIVPAYLPLWGQMLFFGAIAGLGIWFAARERGVRIGEWVAHFQIRFLNKAG